jgi:hypothetical protein
LLSQTLPASTWVWSTTWTEWIPATRVAELASALQPIARRPLKKPKRDPNAQRPPSQRPNEEAARVPPDPGAPREPLPTLGDDAQSGSASNTLRPPGAVPPPPRPVPQLVKQDLRPTRGSAVAIATPIPSVFVGSQRDGGATLASGLDASPHAAKREMQGSRPDTLHEIEARSGVRGAAVSARPAKTAPAVEEAKQAGPAAPTKAVKLGDQRVALWLLSLACAGLGLGLAFSLSALSSRPSALPAAVASTPSSPVLPAHAPGCTLLVPAAKLAPSVERSVEPYFLNLSPDHVAVGFAKTKTDAAGSVIDLNSLDQSPVFEDAGERAVLGTVPTQAEPLTFAVDRDSGQLASPHSLGGSPRTVVGFSKDGLVTRVGDDSVHLVWATPDVPRTQPRVARLGDRNAIVFRQGGQAGSLMVGWLDSNQQKIGDLTALEGAPSLLGTPALAAGKNAAVAAFAGRNSEQEPWRLRLLHIAPDQPARVSVEFSHPSEGAGNGAIAPTLAALGDDRWALQWTQGSSGQYRVFVQALAADLSPLGAPVASSPKGASAGQGAIWVVGERALSLYVLTVGGRDELWGTVLTCR